MQIQTIIEAQKTLSEFEAILYKKLRYTFWDCLLYRIEWKIDQETKKVEVSTKSVENGQHIRTDYFNFDELFG